MGALRKAKRWWSSNPTVSCGLASLAVILVYWVFPFAWFQGFSIGAAGRAVFSGIVWVLSNHADVVFSVLLFCSLYSTCLYVRVWRFYPEQKRERWEALTAFSWLAPLIAYALWAVLVSSN